jgi:PAS domain S-box-containing protein
MSENTNRRVSGKVENLEYDSLNTEEQYEFNLKLLEQTVNSIHECLVITDLGNNIIFVNDAFEKVYGYSREELLGKSITIVRSDKNSPEIYKEISRETKTSKWSGRLFNRRKSGEDFLILLNTSVVKDKKGYPIAMVGASLDLTREVEREKILQSAEDKYRSLFVELKETVYESTPEGRLIDINPAGIELFGYNSKEELLNADIAKDLYVNENDRAVFKEKLEKDGYVKKYEIQIKNKHGEVLTVLETATVVKDHVNNSFRYRGILYDITESKKNQQLLTGYIQKLSTANDYLKESELRLRRSNEEKDKFFSIIAHDLKSPFNSLLALSEFLAEDINELSKEEIQSFAAEINISSKILFKLLENLLQWSQIQTGRLKAEPGVFDIGELFDETDSLLKRNAEGKRIKMEFTCETYLPVYADKNMIRSVIQNLVSNAIKFSRQEELITVTAQPQGNDILVSIIDRGVGMSEEKLKSLFQINRHHSTPGTNNELGTGLGLILCKELVEMNKGRIWVESDLKRGTTFYFTVPGSV